MLLFCQQDIKTVLSAMAPRPPLLSKGRLVPFQNPRGTTVSGPFGEEAQMCAQSQSPVPSVCLS